MRFVRATACALPAVLATLAVVSTPVMALPYQEVGKPAGAAKSAPRGIVLLIHGGAWTRVGREWVAGLRRDAARFRKAGFMTVNTDYRPGYRSLADVTAVYDDLHERYPRTPICAFGESAGGHLSLMLSLRRRSLKCVVARAAPTDLVSLGGTVEAVSVADHAAMVFGLGDLVRWSPALQAERIHSRVMLAYSPGDRFVPIAQGEEMARRLPSAKLVRAIPGEDVIFTHDMVTQASWKAYTTAERRFLAKAMPRKHARS
jgi:dipeptidyl aminopeptidase/acylaminoacyl peptidase